MYLILYTYVCVRVRNDDAGRDGTGRSDRTGLDDSDDDSGVIIVVFMCKQWLWWYRTVVYCEHRWCVRRVRVCVSVCPWCKSIIVVRAAMWMDVSDVFILLATRMRLGEFSSFRARPSAWMTCVLQL